MTDENSPESRIEAYSIYELSTGKFTGLSIGGSRSFIQSNLQEGMGSIPGVLDPLSQRVENGIVVDYQPPQTDPDTYWVHDDEQGKRVRRWMKKPEVVARERAVADAMAALEAIDKRKVRAISEMSLNPAPAARQRLADLESEAEAQRQIIRDNTPKP